MREIGWCEKLHFRQGKQGRKQRRGDIWAKFPPRTKEAHSTFNIKLLQVFQGGTQSFQGLQEGLRWRVQNQKSEATARYV